MPVEARYVGTMNPTMAIDRLVCSTPPVRNMGLAWYSGGKMRSTRQHRI
jgi:hypothetical protein